MLYEYEFFSSETLQVLLIRRLVLMTDAQREND